MRDMSSLDVFFVVNELRNLIGGQIQKIYQQGKAFWLEVYVPAKGAFTLRFEPGKIFITEYRRRAPEQPESFAMFARKHVGGQRITDVRQHGFDRIVELDTEKNIIIFEVFSKGNVIICDKTKRIIMPLEVQLWKDRQVVPRKPYSYPPDVVNPFMLTHTELHGMLAKSDKEIVRFLAVELSLSGLYAEEVCARAQLDKNKLCKKVTDSELLALYEAIHSLVKEFSPRLVYEDSKIVDAVPIELLIYKDKRTERVQTFMHALDEAYTAGTISETEIAKTKAVSNQLARLEHIAAEQQATIEKLKEEAEINRLKAEAIIRNVQLIEEIINSLHAARASGQKWAQIKEQVKTRMPAVKEIQERKGKIILMLN
ncbi:MAG: NFACT family protein [Candidatus Aenigmarchaeota archaeon]|nr:NFACT family protein [Candidatus Aenigmarchaeota archaeon]